ncbi:unnamed protein product [marine sediment metagenome]|uniref:Uncharacterized protein n=1 Tax=marine sediment metagenome TaxID=412755 RepID=X1J0J9_9ZZZZ
MSVELFYRVIHLARIGPSVKMVLEEVRTVPPEEIERARREAEQTPETDVVDEGAQLQKVDLAPKPKTQMEEVFSAMRTQIPEFAEVFKSMSNSGPSRKGVTMRAVPIFQHMEAYFTPEQYKEMGSPPLLSKIRITMSVE